MCRFHGALVERMVIKRGRVGTMAQSPPCRLPKRALGAEADLLPRSPSAESQADGVRPGRDLQAPGRSWPNHVSDSRCRQTWGYKRTTRARLPETVKYFHP